MKNLNFLFGGNGPCVRNPNCAKLTFPFRSTSTFPSRGFRNQREAPPMQWPQIWHFFSGHLRIVAFLASPTARPVGFPTILEALPKARRSWTFHLEQSLLKLPQADRLLQSFVTGECSFAWFSDYCRIRLFLNSVVVKTRAMVSRSVSSKVAPAAVLFLGLLLGQCSCQTVPQIVVLGGNVGWTHGANLNYTQFMASVPFKAGDTLRFNNTDNQDHNVLQVYSQADYDACNSNNNTGWTVNSADIYDLPFPDPAYRVWIIDPAFCLVGQKVEFAVLDSDGTPVPADTGADPPSLNAPPASDYNSPPNPPSPPGLAGGPIPNAASTSQVGLAIAMIVSSACYLAARF